MKKLLLSFVLLPFLAQAQTTAPTPKDTLWETGGVTSLNFTQVSLNNWAGGGQSSVSVAGFVDLFANYEKGEITWANSLTLGYGLQQQGDEEVRKTDDRIEFSSQLGKKINKKLSYSGFLGLRTQFAPGYNYPNDSVKISDFFAPGYVLLSLGIDYKPKKWIQMYVSPVTSKITVVGDQTLADAGAFGVDPGKNVRTEFGGMARMTIKKDIMKNVTLSTNVQAFSNYKDNPDHIDVNWETLIDMKINKFLSASISTNLIYDHDIDIEVDTDGDDITDKVGPRVQFKEVLAIGLSYKF